MDMFLALRGQLGAVMDEQHLNKIREFENAQV
jgi:hypothetical protein